MFLAITWVLALEHRNGGGGVSFCRGTSCDDKEKEEKKPEKAKKEEKVERYTTGARI